MKQAILSDSEPLWWEKIGKVVNQLKLPVLNDSEPLWWEEIGKVANQVKLAILSDSELLQWENIGKVANRPKFAVPNVKNQNFFINTNSNFALPLTKIGHNMNAIDILVKLKNDPIGTVAITNDLHCQEVKKRLDRIVLGLNLV